MRSIAVFNLVCILKNYLPNKHLSLLLMPQGHEFNQSNLEETFCTLGIYLLLVDRAEATLLALRGCRV